MYKALISITRDYELKPQNNHLSSASAMQMDLPVYMFSSRVVVLVIFIVHFI